SSSYAGVPWIYAVASGRRRDGPQATRRGTPVRRARSRLEIHGTRPRSPWIRAPPRRWLARQGTRMVAQRRGAVPRAADPETAVPPAGWRRPPRIAGAAWARPSELGLISR